ncbi:cyclopropane-fatty-acyl-phospholipid synthase [Aspergillus steynii IBT 23096]|uniref:Cyclopropane-fatty-acyl-phospholipid synthase n=1 Tax=Aspergillus steynii IBT 23096 TaxID=1392250 RepID=A0A2I2G092_9EURO|nr:cyclopropane-fatty-acyl-phospholipid synthase [Aspergillus steynii IBT 23096]PLB46301.1 cyclopropane-fatty-acyl-phospholipid synthase [Aspergillus steynii IBT 23096]
MDLGRVLGSVAKRVLDGAQSTLLWSSVQLISTDIARKLVLSSLTGIAKGYLEIRSSDGKEWTFGSTKTGPSACIQVHDPRFWYRILISADIGFADLFMLGEITTDLKPVFQIFIRNHDSLSNFTTRTSTIFAAVSDLLLRTTDTNTVQRTALNVAAHYDLSNDMFAAFLSPDMTYSGPIYLPQSHPDHALDTLEQAQYRKLDCIIRSLHLESTDHLLEFGSGWGSMAIRAASTTGCRVTSITLSERQKELAEQRIEEAGLGEKITVLLCDYRSLPVPEVPYDKFVAIEMIEANLNEDLEVIWGVVDRMLKREGGLACVQTVVMPESRYINQFPKGEGFIPRYIFPGGHNTSLTRFLEAVNKGTQCRLSLESLQEYDAHYARALAEWRGSFVDQFERRIGPALRQEYGLSEAEVQVFRRKYVYYFTYTEAGFSEKVLHVTQMVFAREGTRGVLEDVGPWSR